MGMFDSVYIKRDLPLSEELKQVSVDWKNIEFQTKDLENCLLEYTITEDGTLLEKVVEREYIPYTEEERKKIKPKPWNIWKEVIHKSEELKEVNHHGIVDLYCSVDYTEDDAYWVEFRSHFIYGKLDKIELLRSTKQESSKANAKKWKKAIELEEKKLWNRTKKFLNYFGWNKFWRKISNVCYKLSRGFAAIQIFIIRYL
jgi:hypothetical protein